MTARRAAERRLTPLQRWLVGAVRGGGLPQVELARRVGISEKHLSQLMNGCESGSLEVWDALLREAGVRL